MFLVPITYNGKTGIGLEFLQGWIRAPFRGYELPLIVAIVVCSALGSAWFQAFKPQCRDTHPTLDAMFNVPPQWLLLRVASACVGVMV